MSRWFSHTGRATVLGVWNVHANLGNVFGKIVATAVLARYGWQYAFVTMGGICCFVACIQYLFLVPRPQQVLNAEEIRTLALTEHDSHQLPDQQQQHDESPPDSARISNQVRPANSSAEAAPLVHDVAVEYPPVSFHRALLIPGVIPFSLALFFTKLLAYAWINWSVVSRTLELSITTTLTQLAQIASR